MDALQRAVIRSEIEALNAEFAYLIDHGLSEGVADLFTEDGSYGRASGERTTGRAALRKIYEMRAARGARTAAHVFTNLRLTIESETQARGVTFLVLFAEDGAAPQPAEVNLVSEYEDVYRRGDDGAWRYASRTVRRLFEHPGGKESVLPLGARVS
jgi:ketosteroid isomerase-like protein